MRDAHFRESGVFSRLVGKVEFKRGLTQENIRRLLINRLKSTCDCLRLSGRNQEQDTVHSDVGVEIYDSQTYQKMTYQS